MIKRIVPLVAVLVLACTGCISSASYQLTSDPPGKLLSVHKTLARFDGFKVQPCHHMTADCPNQCEHGGIYAAFTIEEYLSYQKPDAYGDEEQKQFYVRMSSLKDVPDATLVPALRKVILQLEPGDEVALDWVHVYVSYPDGLQTPERIVTWLAQ